MLITKNALDLLNPDEFNFKYARIAGDECVLVCPKHNGIKWNEFNMKFRSSAWVIDGYNLRLISASYKKFFNYNEHPELVSDPTGADILDSQIVEKIDGSTLIISSYKGELIVRTRGTWDASKLENGDEIEFLKQKYPNAFEFPYSTMTSPYSYIYEWYSPKNVIVLNYGDEPTLTLTGIVRHSDYSLFKQDTLDHYASLMMMPRPKYYSFGSLEETIETTKALTGAEGVCIYFRDGQEIKKLKGDEYLARHALKSQVTLANMLDYFLTHPEIQSVDDFQKVSDFDFETWKLALPLVQEIFQVYNIVCKSFDHVTDMVETNVKTLSTRKEQALYIQKYLAPQYQSVAFGLLDGRNITRLDLARIVKKGLNLL